MVTTQAQADALPRKEEAQADFQREVLEVNREFAEEYIRKYERDGYRAVIGVGASPRTPFNRGLPPTIGERFRREPFARVTGDVRLGDDVTVGRRTSIRADEGAPIAIGDGAEIEDRVTFHALRGTSITIGSGLDTDDNVVFHGPLVVGDDLTIADDAVLFRATVGDDVTIGEGALVVGPADDPLDLPDGLERAAERRPHLPGPGRRAGLTTAARSTPPARAQAAEAAGAPRPAVRPRASLRAGPIPGTLAPCSSDGPRSWRRSVRRPTRRRCSTG